MLAEADDFIDLISDGRQDHQADAVLHAVGGSGRELEAVRKSRRLAVPRAEGLTVREIAASPETGGVPLRLYLPAETAGKPIPTLVYLHGGGWCFGSVESCGAFCTMLSSSGKAAVLAVDYSLAPENPFPKALGECSGVLDYAVAHAGEWGSAPDLVSVGGDSAGGNLALASVLARGKEKPPVRSLVLFYPVVKAWADKSDSWKKWNRGYGLDSRLMEAFNSAYAGKTDPKDKLISPATASGQELGSLPPMLIVSAERDILLDQAREMATAVNSNGGNASHVVFPGAVHLFITVDGQPTARNKAADTTLRFLTGLK